MWTTLLPAIGLLFIQSEKILCAELAGRCLKYEPGEVKPGIYGGDRFCLTEKDFDYCREWSCHPKCSNFEKWPGHCEACPDTCAVGGRLYDLMEFFKCVDNANECQCLKENKFLSTRKNRSVQEMCFDELRNVTKESD